jgi:hypothetical protein
MAIMIRDGANVRGGLFLLSSQSTIAIYRSRSAQRNDIYSMEPTVKFVGGSRPMMITVAVAGCVRTRDVKTWTRSVASRAARVPCKTTASASKCRLTSWGKSANPNGPYVHT